MNIVKSVLVGFISRSVLHRLLSWSAMAGMPQWEYKVIRVSITLACSHCCGLNAGSILKGLTLAKVRSNNIDLLNNLLSPLSSSLRFPPFVMSCCHDNQSRWLLLNQSAALLPYSSYLYYTERKYKRNMQHLQRFYWVTIRIRKSVNWNEFIRVIYGFHMTGNTDMHILVTDTLK